MANKKGSLFKKAGDLIRNVHEIIYLNRGPDRFLKPVRFSCLFDFMHIPNSSMPDF
jgi:hypothetical protein